MNNHVIKKDNQEIPEFFRPIFWSYNFGTLDSNRNKKTIILNAINYGTMRHWSWLKKHYGEDIIRETLESVPATALKKRAGKLAELLFNVELNHASRGAH